MREEIKGEWVKALRSGKYKKGTGRLAKESANGEIEYCCLGVLCEVARELDFDLTLRRVGNPSGDFDISYDGATGILPGSVANWAELPNEPDVTFDGEVGMPITVVNDDYELSFSQIADIIEENL